MKQTKLKQKLFLLLLLFAFTFLSCSSNPTEPPKPPPPPVEPDSTTQDFTFETFEFGDGLSTSYLNDVWIFNENNIWAVGDISPENGETFTNILRWNGVKWNHFEREFVSTGFTGIWAIDSNNIYLASGVIRKYENGAIKTIDLTHLTFSNNQSVNKLWGSSENNIYGVGRNGIIVHYDGSPSGAGWTKIDFDTKWRFDAITGSKQTGIAYASATNQSFNTIIVKLENNTAEIIYNSANTTERLTAFTIQMLTDSLLYLAHSKIWKLNLNTNTTEVLFTMPPTFGILRSSFYSNIDMYFFGDQLPSGEELVHYNGKRFTIITFDKNRNDLIYGGAYAIKDLAVLTGFSNNKAYLVKVKRR